MDDKHVPGDWDELLQRFAATLAGVEQTLAKADTLETPATTGGRADTVQDLLLPDHASKVEGLDGKAAEIGQWVDALESELRVSEDLLRVLLTQTETVRAQLATWAGRAIG